MKNTANKKYISENNIYNSYINENSENLPVIKNILNIMSKSGIKSTDNLINALIIDCAVQLIISRTSQTCEKTGLSEYINNSFNDNGYMYLADELIGDKMKLLSVIRQYPQLFENKYSYNETEDTLGLLYISLKDICERKTGGIYYTPAETVRKMCDRLFADGFKKNGTILDPCCGTGSFIMQFPENIDYNNIYGSDIDKMSVKIARINYALKYLVSDKDTVYKHIYVSDYLQFSDDPKFDYIIGNPPWGCIYSDSQKKYISKNFKSAENFNSCDLFIEKALRNLKEDGILSFAVPQAVLNVRSHMKIREIILEYASFQYVEFLGNIFDKVLCPSIILQAIRTNTHVSLKKMIVKDKKHEFTITHDRQITAECFSFNITDNEYSIIRKIENTDNTVTLSGSNAVFAMGIVTGDNKKYISDKKTPDNEIILKGTDIYRFRAGKPKSYITFRPDLFQQTAPAEYYRAKEKLLYRFICSQLVFAYDCGQTLSLNSCNILIPKIPGLDIKYIMAVLNSRTVQFYFRKKFDSVKVLKSHLEKIPIPMASGEVQKEITEIVDRLLETPDKHLVREYFDKTDNIIAEIYNLNADEYKIICESMSGENMFMP